MSTVDSIITRFSTEGESALRGVFSTLSSDVSTLEGKMARVNLASNAALGAGAGLAGVLGLIGAKSLGAAGQIEGVQAGLTGMLGSADAAKSKIKELQNFAATTPFDFAQTAAASQQLLAMGFSADELIPTLNKVGNAVASAGGGTEQFKGVLLALGQIRTKGKLSAEELMQMAERGIPVFEILQKQLGLTKAEVSNIGNSGIDAKKGIDALLKGMGEVGGGTALEEMSNTLPGKLSNLGDSVNQLQASVGTLFSSDAKDFLGGVTEKLDALRKWVDENPDMAKKLFAALGIGAGALVLGGLAGKAAGIYNEITDALGKTTKGKKALEAATKADDLAEKAKAATAAVEGDAIGGVGEEAEATAKKMSLLSRVKGFLGNPLSIGGRGLTQVGGAEITGGMAVGAAALGVGAGYGAYDDYSAMGDKNAAMKGAATGVATAAAAMFLPGAAIPIAIAEGFRYAFNELVNVPMEKAATEGSGASGTDQKALRGATSNEDKAKVYDAIAQRKFTESQDQTLLEKLSGVGMSDRQKELRADSASARQQAAMYRGGAYDKKTSINGYHVDPAADARFAAQEKADYARQRVENQRNGETVIKIPNRPSDLAQRQRHHTARTPMPAMG